MSDRLLSAPNWIVSTLGFTGILVVFGFIVDQAFQTRLGYQIQHEWSLQHYAALGGRFLYDCLAGPASAHPVWTLLVIVALVVVYWTLPKRARGAEEQQRDHVRPTLRDTALGLLFTHGTAQGGSRRRGPASHSGERSICTGVLALSENPVAVSAASSSYHRQ